jgi:hypothetical protein
MSYVNGTTTHETPAPPIATAPNGSDAVLAATPSTIQLDEVRRKLLEPFDPGEIKWRVTATSKVQTKHGPQKRGQLVAYADQRAYTDRLNEVFGEWGWTRTYAVQVAQNFERRLGSEGKTTAVAAKVVVVSTVTIHDLGAHTGVGEEWADDENAATRAEAQAFKRACACFGLGRYLYDLDKVWVDLDQYNRPVQTPELPDWARPASAQPQHRAQPAPQSRPPAQPRQSLVQQETLAKVQELCEAVGFGLSRFVLRTYAGVADPTKIGFAKLTTVMERLTDISNGVERLRKAIDAIGVERYVALCRDMNLASDSLDDIPDRNTLRVLLEKAEQKPVLSTPSGTGIAEARGRFLQAARKVAESGRIGWPKKLGDVIVQASNGALTLESLRNLTDADVDRVVDFTTRLAG